MEHCTDLTLTEWLAVVFVVLIVGVTTYAITAHHPGLSASPGMQERCISGYKHTVTPRGDVRQLVSGEGKGVPCQ